MAAVENFQVDQSVLPAAGTWELDPTHTEVSFTARHLMVTKVRGRFPGTERHDHDRGEPAPFVRRRRDRRRRREQW